MQQLSMKLPKRISLRLKQRRALQPRLCLVYELCSSIVNHRDRSFREEELVTEISYDTYLLCKHVSYGNENSRMLLLSRPSQQKIRAAG